MKQPKTLSNTALFILGIIGDNPVNPYAIYKLANHKRKSFRRPLHVQTVYSVVKALHKRKLISVEKAKSGNMPDKNMYSITQKGTEILKYNLTSLLSNPEDPLTELSLAIFTMGNLDKGTVLLALKEYQRKINQELAARKKQNFEESQRGLPSYSIVAIEHIMDILKVNRKTVDKLIRKIETDEQWNIPPIPFWRDDIT